jgi:diguanylate cyclase (GGDEF)-like protein
MALSLPVLASALAPDWSSRGVGVFVWLPVLTAPFLLSFYRGWQGAAMALVVGGLALVLASSMGSGPQEGDAGFRYAVWMVSTYMVVCVGAGLVSLFLNRERVVEGAMALTDPMTGMPNRRHALVVLEAGFASAVRGDPVTLVMMNPDPLERLKTERGPREFDLAVKTFAQALQTVTRRMDLSARWDEDAFVSILQHCSASGAEIFLGRLRGQLEAADRPDGILTFAAGIAEYGPGMGSADAMMEAAEQALRAAREAGGDCHRTAAPPPVISEFTGVRREEGATSPTSTVVMEGEADRVPGTLFTGDEPSEVLLVHAGVSLPQGNEQILVVDDDRESRRALGKLLRRLGYRVVEAPDGESALASARSLEQLDLMITDLVMPGLSGFTLRQRLQEDRGPSRALFISGAVSRGVEWAAGPLAVERHLDKPVRAVDLATAVRDILDEPIPGTPPSTTPSPSSPSSSERT